MLSFYLFEASGCFPLSPSIAWPPSPSNIHIHTQITFNFTIISSIDAWSALYNKQMISNPNWHKPNHQSSTKLTTNQIKLNSHHKISTRTQLTNQITNPLINLTLTQIKISTQIINQKEMENKPKRNLNNKNKKLTKTRIPKSLLLLLLLLLFSLLSSSQISRILYTKNLYNSHLISNQ